MRSTQSRTRNFLTKNTNIEDQSYLDCDEETANFYGTLDIATLGGAGFASQRTTGDDRKWDLSDYAGIELDIAKGDSMAPTIEN